MDPKMEKHELSTEEQHYSNADWAEAHKAAASASSLNRYIIGVVVWACTACMTWGYGANIIGSSLAQPSMAEYFDFATTPNVAKLQGATASVFNAGALFGFWASAWVSDRYGRKGGLLWTSCWAIVGQAITGGSTNSWGMLLVGRLLSGFGCFPAGATAILYASEFGIAETRGFIGGLPGLMVAVAYAVASWVGLGWSFYESPNAWRGPLLMGMIWPVFTLALWPFMPDTPRWLSAQGRNDEALVILKKMHRNKQDPHDTYAILEAEQLRQQSVLEKTLPHSWGYIFSRPSMRMRAYHGILAFFMLQCTGILVLTNFLPILYSGLQFQTTDQLLFSGGWITIAPVGSFIWIFYIDRVGRKIPLTLCPLFCAINLTIFAVLVKYYGPEGTSAAGKAAAVAMTFIYMAMYICVEIPLYIYVAEIWPTHLRAKGIQIAFTSYALNAIWCTQAGPIGLAALGWKYTVTFVFVGLSLGNALACWLIFVETTGIPLEEVAAIFGDTDEVAITMAQLSTTNRDVAPKQA